MYSKITHTRVLSPRNETRVIWSSDFWVHEKHTRVRGRARIWAEMSKFIFWRVTFKDLRRGRRTCAECHQSDSIPRALKTLRRGHHSFVYEFNITCAFEDNEWQYAFSKKTLRFELECFHQSWDTSQKYIFREKFKYLSFRCWANSYYGQIVFVLS